MFSLDQLEVIEKTANKITDQKDEMAVFNKLFGTQHLSFQQMSVLEYCAKECERQASGAISVYDMVNAWNFAVTIHKHQPNKLDTSLIQVIGMLVEPIDNKNGFRTIPIYVGNSFFAVEKAKYWDIERLLEHLLASYYAGDLGRRVEEVRSGLIGHTAIAQNAEDQFYYEYEEIHPFRDGNGRTGKILYNYLLNKLDDPQMPPNFYGGSNP